MKVLLFVYDVVLCASVPFYCIAMVLRGKWSSVVSTRWWWRRQDFRFLTQKKPIIWIHAVSLGEVATCKTLVRELCQRHPEKQILITTITDTGKKIAESLETQQVKSLLLPFDISFLIAPFLSMIHPEMIVLMETELWPQFLYYAYRDHIPVVVFNARLSDRSLFKYRRMRFLVPFLTQGIRYIATQSALDYERFRSLGIADEKLRHTGNMKFDAVHELSPLQRQQAQSYAAQLTIQNGDFLIVAGSTHDSEEEMLIEVVQSLKGEFPQLQLLLAPRHLERLSAIEQLIAHKGYRSMRVSALQKDWRDSILLLDSIGVLHAWYDLAHLVVMGGSFAPIGGHNILEPAICARAIIVGPHMHNFRSMFELFKSQQAVDEASDKDALTHAIRRHIKDPTHLATLSAAAHSVVVSHQGATHKNISLLEEILHETR